MTTAPDEFRCCQVDGCDYKERIGSKYFLQFVYGRFVCEPCSDRFERGEELSFFRGYKAADGQLRGEK